MDEALRIFHIEASELLDEMESALIRLDDSYEDIEAIDSVFRAAHTIKGSSGLVGLERIEDFTHSLENLLDLLRSGKLRVDGRVMELLFQCRDHTNSLISGVTKDTAPPDLLYSEGEKLTRELNNLSTTLDSKSGTGHKQYEGNWHISLRFAPDILMRGMDPASFLRHLESLGEITYLKTIFDSMPGVADMDPESCYLGLEAILESRTTGRQIRNIFGLMEENCELRIIPPGSPAGSYLDLIADLPERDEVLREIFLESGSLNQSDIIASLNTSGQRPPSPAKRDSAPIRSSTIRVDVSKLDRLIDTVGELVISGDAIREEATRQRNSHLSNLTDNLLRLIDEVRDSSMSVRMTPLSGTFTRFKRTVRDMCHESGKDVELLVGGGETELDRTVIEKIQDPLMHLVRNAIDHGIETCGERLDKGKQAKGVLRLNAYQETGFIVIEVSDDGKGLNEDLIVTRAREKGVLGKDEIPSADLVPSLIFEPGFSTAPEVTSTSGRGVGMDVVKRNIESLKGSVEVQSVPDSGTTFRVRLPLTLAIIDGFLVTVGMRNFVIPMDMVLECLELTGEDRRAAHGRDHISLRGEVMPYIRLRRIFDITDEASGHEHILVVRHAGKAIGLLVDSLVGEISTVIKSLGIYYREVKGISGATVMGDGSVALIVDVQALVRSATKKSV